MLWSLISTDMLERLLLERHWTRDEFADRLGLLLHEAFVTRTKDARTTARPPRSA